MPLSNIRKGITKVMIGQIIDFISTLLTFIMSVFFSVNDAKFTDPTTMTEMDALLNLVVIFGLTALSALLFVAASVMYIIGLRQAGKEEVSFRVSLICFCVCLPLRFFTLFFIHTQSSWYFLTETITTLIYMMAVLYLIQGVRRTADRLDDKKVEKRGDILFRLMIVICVTEAFSEIAVIIATGTPAEVASPVITLFATILSIIQYIITLLFLGNTLRMLKKEQDLPDKYDDSEILSEN